MDIREHIINIAAAAIAIEYMERGLDGKYRGWRHLLCFTTGGGVYFALMSVLNYFTDFEGIFCVFYGAALILYGVLTLNGSFYHKVFLSLMWVLNVLFSTFLVYGVMGFLGGRNLQDIFSGTDKNVIFYASLSVTALKFLTGRVILRLYGRKGEIYGKGEWQIAGVLFIVLLAGLNMFELELDLTGGRWRYGRLICLLVCQFSGVLFLEWLYQKLEEYRRKRLDSEFRDQMAREINHWRHDMNSRLDTLYRLQTEGQYAEVKKILGEMCEGFEKLPELMQETDNSGLNTALVRALALCRDKGIHFSYAVSGRVNLIDDMDMESMMVNLLTNGVEACSHIEGTRVLDMILCEKDGKMRIRIENSILDSVVRRNPQMQSSKADKLSHGFGMRTVYEVLDKYEGEYLCWEEGNLFIQELCLYIPQN